MQPYSPYYLPKLQAYQHEMVQRLETIVNIDSGSGLVDGLDRISAYLKRWLGEIGFTVTLHPTETCGRNVEARRKGKGGIRLLLVGHIDTVYPVDATAEQPFHIKNGLAYGPGVIDMKSGVIMGIYALRVLIESGFEEYGELCVVFNTDEEIGSVSSTPLLREVAKQIDMGLVLEPSRSPEIITNARKGADHYKMEITGIPAHSGAEPHRGRSAVIELAHKMLAVHNLNTLSQSITFNVTRISSSEPLNVVPDAACCHISVRAHDEQGLDVAQTALEKIAAGCSVPDTHTQLTRRRGRTPYKPTPAMHQMVEMAKIEGQGLGLHITAERKGGVSDANTLIQAGIPTLDSLGPIGGGMHDLSREYLRVDSLSLRGALLAGLIQRLCLSKQTGTEP